MTDSTQIDRSIRSPNQAPRHGRQIQMIVLHATVGAARSALAWLTNPASHVSAHYLIDKSGHTYQLVPDEAIAWHAGQASWHGETAINEISLGIELENANNGRDPYPAAQIDALLALARDKVAQYGIRPDMVARHLDVALPRGRKNDPAGFPWATFIGQLFPQAAAPAGPTPRPAPPSGLLSQALLAEAYRQVGAANQQEWAIARAARAERLGLPIGPSFTFQVAGRSYTGQSFGRDTMVCPTGDWQRIERLSTLATREQQPLREALLAAIYAQAGESYHADWAFHQFALRSPVGPPLGASFHLAVQGQEFVAACYALDILYCPAGRWQEIGRLSALGAAKSQRALAEALQARWFERAGAMTRPDWPLDQYGLREQLGAPLGPSFRVSSGGRDYVAEAFALDVVTCEIGSWKAITRLSTMA